MAPPLISLRDARLSLGGKGLFHGLDLDVHEGERICLVGRNGAGKSSLLKVIAGQIALDSGEHSQRARVMASYLPQEPQLDSKMRIVDAVLSAGPSSGEAEERLHLAEQWLFELGMPPERTCHGLSGGERRRVSLAQTLVGDPDILLLDEPTNHLDLPMIEWLEATLKNHKAAIVMISHDRRFLTQVSAKTWWLDRGGLRVLGKGYGAFEAWRDKILDEEEQEASRLAQKIKAEQHWLHRGVTARRKRNQGRLQRLPELRAARAKLLRRDGGPKLETQLETRSGALVIEAESAGKAFGDKMIVENFNLRVMRGDRLGIVGPNGAGKSTLIGLLLGEQQPDRGMIRQGTNLEIARFDQTKQSLDEKLTPWQILCPDGGDRVMVGTQSRHVVGYLRDFLFDEPQARAPVRTLSGGERSRLLLAKILAAPSNLLVLDEPTNDLDIETLDLLEEMLADYRGTVILVSHDRDFLDRIVTSTVLMDGKGGAGEHAGGYSDIPQEFTHAAPAAATQRPAAKVAAAKSQIDRKLERELLRLPARMEAVTAEISALDVRLADPALSSDAAQLSRLALEAEAKRQELEQLEERWLELEEMREQGLV